MSDPKTVRFNRLSTQGVVLWLGYSNLACLTVAVSVLAIATLNAGIGGALLTAPLWGFLTFVGVRRKHGVPLPIIYWREFMFQLRKSTGKTAHLTRPEKKPVLSALGRLNLPGRAGYLQLWETGRRVVVVFDPQLGTASITCVLYGDDFLGASVAEQDQRVEAWARVKGSWTLRDGIDRIAVLERTAPGTALAARTYFTEHAADRYPALRASYEQSLARTDAQVVRHLTQVTLTFNTRALKEEVKANGGGKAGLLSYLEVEIEAATSALSAAGFVGIRWLTAREWAGAGRTALDPDYAPMIESRTGDVDLAGADPLAIGAMALQEHRTYVSTDSGFHRTFWIHEWPRLETFPGFTKHVVFATLADGAPIRHIFNIVESPVTIRDALKRIADAKKTWRYNAIIRAKRGLDESAADRAEWKALEEQEEQLVAGRGEYRYSAYLTITETSLDRLERASSAMRNALSRAGLEPQLLYAQQAEALLLNAFPTGKGMK